MAMEILPGTRVRLEGLQSASHFNGRIGTVAGFDSVKKRYAVELDSTQKPIGKIVNAKQSNVIALHLPSAFEILQNEGIAHILRDALHREESRGEFSMAVNEEHFREMVMGDVLASGGHKLKLTTQLHYSPSNGKPADSILFYGADLGVFFEVDGGAKASSFTVFGPAFDQKKMTHSSGLPGTGERAMLYALALFLPRIDDLLVCQDVNFRHRVKNAFACSIMFRLLLSLSNSGSSSGSSSKLKRKCKAAQIRIVGAYLSHVHSVLVVGAFNDITKLVIGKDAGWKIGEIFS